MRPNKNHPIVQQLGRDIKRLHQTAKDAQYLPRLDEWEKIGKWATWGNGFSNKFELPYDFQIVKDFELYAEEVLIPAGWEWNRNRDFSRIWNEKDASIEYHFTKQLLESRHRYFDVRF